MDQETREFIEKSFEKWTGIVSNEIQSVRKEMKDMGNGFRQDMENLRHALRSEIHTAEDTLRHELKQSQTEIMGAVEEVRQIAVRMENTLADKLEAQGDEIQETRQRVERIESHLNLPHSLSAAA
jgi:chromosome segregation ATPase